MRDHYNTYTAQEIRENNPDLEIGDIVTVNDQRYAVTSKQYEGSTNSLPIIKYELSLLEGRDFRFLSDESPFPHVYSDPFVPRTVEIMQQVAMRSRAEFDASEWNKSKKLTIKQPKEISEKTREEFLRLLE